MAMRSRWTLAIATADVRDVRVRGGDGQVFMRAVAEWIRERAREKIGFVDAHGGIGAVRTALFGLSAPSPNTIDPATPRAGPRALQASTRVKRQPHCSGNGVRT